jgi:hypothetical protein
MLVEDELAPDVHELPPGQQKARRREAEALRSLSRSAVSWVDAYHFWVIWAATSRPPRPNASPKPIAKAATTPTNSVLTRSRDADLVDRDDDRERDDRDLGDPPEEPPLRA